MKTAKKVLALTVLAVMAAAMTAGCGGSKDTSIPETTTAKNIETTAAKTVENETAKEVAEGGKLVIAIPLSHNTFFLPQSTSTSDRFGAQPVIESLGRADEEGNYYPWLAEEFYSDPDNLIFTIKLRQ